MMLNKYLRLCVAAVMDCYSRWNQLFPATLKTKFKEKLIQKAPYKAGTTSNERLMGAVARFLATETWGADAFAPG